MNLSSKIEAVLFWKGEPVTIKKLIAIFKVEESEIIGALNNLEKELENRGIVLQRKDDEVTLSTSREASSIIETLTKEELVKDLGKAGLETLSIVLYRGPIKRSEIDYIRGVSSSFIVRNLLVRGLIERVEVKEGGGRGYSYGPTFLLLSHLGLKSLTDLPDYEKVQAEIADFKKSQEEKSDETQPEKVEEIVEENTL
jgi:segregation and condensation protein B